jgi:hypothetical protein
MKIAAWKLTAMAAARGNNEDGYYSQNQAG